MKNNTAQQNIPSGWKQATLAMISDVVMGQSPDSSSYNKAGEGLPFFQGKADFTNTNKTIIRQWTSEPTKIAEPADTLISVRAPVGDVAVNSVRACIGRGLAAVRAKKQITNQEYLFYVLLSFKTFFNTKAQGSTFTAINGPELKKISLLLPPIKEQQKIAEILGTVDEDIAKTQEVIGATEKLKRGLMQQLFTRGIGHTKFKKTKLGEIPEEWTHYKLNQVTKQITDGTHRTPKYIQDGVPFLRVTDIQTQEIDWSDVKYISREEHEELIKRCNPQKGDVLLSKNGTIGITKVIDWDKDFSIFVSLCLIKPDTKQISAEYLCEILRSDFVLDQVKMRSKQGSVTNLHLEEIRDFDIPLPKLPEQKKISEILSAIDEKISVDKKLKAKLTVLKKGLMQDLLSGNKRVKV